MKKLFDKERVVKLLNTLTKSFWHDEDGTRRYLLELYDIDIDGFADEIIKEVSHGVDELIRMLIIRDGGDHDVDCKANRGSRCNCGHDTVARFLNDIGGR